MRTQEEILERIRRVEESDLLGFRVGALLIALSFENAEPWRAEGYTAEKWEEATAATEEKLIVHALGYLEFAMGKADAHRGISAGRSITKLYEFAWLLGREDVMKAMDVADYPQYGVPKLRAFAQTMGPQFQKVWDFRVCSELALMAEGQPCGAEYECGCGQ